MLDLIQAYENYLSKVKHASDNTIASYMRDIRQFSQWLNTTEGIDVIDASQLNISDYMHHQESEGRSGATMSRCLASLKNFYLYLVSSGFLERTPVTDIHIDRGEKKLPQILTGREIELLLSQPVCVDAKGYRDKAMLEVLYATGMRVTELISLDVDDVNLELGIIKCSSARKSRAIPLYPAALKALSNYLKDVRSSMLATPDETALFVNVGGQLLDDLQFVNHTGGKRGNGSQNAYAKNNFGVLFHGLISFSDRCIFKISMYGVKNIIFPSFPCHRSLPPLRSAYACFHRGAWGDTGSGAGKRA